VSGSTGCGKSTTQAALIDYINTHKSRNIVTIEDPIEFLHKDKKSIVNQRELGIDTRSFTSALRMIMRQDPDVIMIGEMRERESFTAMLAAAEVGRFVVSTSHSPDAAQVVLRMLDFFSPGERDQARFQLAANLVAVICQRLLRRADRKGMVPAVEILRGTPVVRRLVRENKLEKLPDAIAAGGEEGMQSFNGHLVELVKAGIVSEDEALKGSTNPDALKMNLQGIYLNESHGILGDG
jgi:pilus retraction protein PilT